LRSTICRVSAVNEAGLRRAPDNKGTGRVSFHINHERYFGHQDRDVRSRRAARHRPAPANIHCWIKISRGPRNDRDGAGAARAYCDLEASYDHAVNGRSATSVGQSRLTRPTWSARRVCAGSRWADQLGLRKAKMTKGMATWCRAPSIVGERHLLRVVQRRAHRHAEAPRVVGVDDWVFRRNNRYGTLICDLDRCGL
jgi:hypothetical protein